MKVCNPKKDVKHGDRLRTDLKIHVEPLLFQYMVSAC